MANTDLTTSDLIDPPITITSFLDQKSDRLNVENQAPEESSAPEKKVEETDIPKSAAKCEPQSKTETANSPKIEIEQREAEDPEGGCLAQFNLQNLGNVVLIFGFAAIMYIAITSSKSTSPAPPPPPPATMWQLLSSVLQPYPVLLAFILSLFALCMLAIEYIYENFILSPADKMKAAKKEFTRLFCEGSWPTILSPNPGTALPIIRVFTSSQRLWFTSFEELSLVIEEAGYGVSISASQDQNRTMCTFGEQITDPDTLHDIVTLARSVHHFIRNHHIGGIKINLYYTGNISESLQRAKHALVITQFHADELVNSRKLQDAVLSFYDDCYTEPTPRAEFKIEKSGNTIQSVMIHLNSASALYCGDSWYNRVFPTAINPTGLKMWLASLVQ